MAPPDPAWSNVARGDPLGGAVPWTGSGGEPPGPPLVFAEPVPPVPPGSPGIATPLARPAGPTRLVQRAQHGTLQPVPEQATAPVPESAVPTPVPEPLPAPPPSVPAVGAAGAAVTVGVVTPAVEAPLEPEELLKRLFDPLLRRLRVELRLDRERFGVSMDGG